MARLAAIVLASCLWPHVPADMIVLTPTADARIMAISPNMNEGALFSISVYNRDSNIQRSALRFDLAGVPAGSTVLTASLRLVERDLEYTSGGLPTFLHRATTDWIEGEVTWNRASNATPWSSGPGGDYSPLYSSAHDLPDRTLVLDATLLVQEWINGIHPNFGFFLTSPAGNELHFHSRETTTGLDANRPQLSVTFAPVPEPATLGTLLLGTATLLRRRRR